MIDNERGENAPLTVKNRLRLVQTLNALPQTQFDELVFALKPPERIIPDYSGPQGNRSTALLEWAESSVGPGLEKLEAALEEIISISSKSKTISFAISGSIEDNVQYEQLQAIIKLLRSIAGDDSIEISFIDEG